MSPEAPAPGPPAGAPAPWPAERIERRPLAALIPSARNARTHSTAQVASIAGSIREWGWTMPVLVDEQESIIAGHGRVLAAEVLGLTEVPVIVARGWSESRKRAYALADNKLALNAAWDLDMLRAELSDLREHAVDLDALGFAALEVDQLFAADAGPQWDGMPEFVQPRVEVYQSITVHFKNAEAVAEFAARIGQRIERTTRFTWFPYLPRERFRDKRYVTTEEPSGEQP